MIFIAQLGSHPFAEMGRLPPHVHGHVEDSTAERLHELCLWVFLLKMQAAQRAAARAGDVVLYKLDVNSRLGISVALIRLFEKAASIRKHFRLDYQDAGNFGWNDVHRLLVALFGPHAGSARMPACRGRRSQG